MKTEPFVNETEDHPPSPPLKEEAYAIELDVENQEGPSQK
jgi:hypothetical protein